MTYPEAIDFLYTQLPMYQNVGKSAVKKDLKNITALTQVLDNPQHKFKSIHIAGTNGKGTTSHILSSLFQSEGLKVGLYTSPHYKDFRERIKINGRYISKKKVCDFISQIKPVLKTIQASFFEITVAMAFNYFAQETVDIAIVETGLGGRLDSTNIIRPELCVITNISFDHQSMLGNTLALIAQEKAGIIKSRIPVVIGEKQHGIQHVFTSKAKEMGAKLHYAESICSVDLESTTHVKSKYIISLKDMTTTVNTDLVGPFQRYNLRTALSAYALYKQINHASLRQAQIRSALRSIKSLTKYMGRWHVKRSKPVTILDSGHNEGGIKYAMTVLKSIPQEKLHIILGFVKDKNWLDLLGLFPKGASFYFCKPNIRRGLEQEELRVKAASIGYVGKAYTTVRGAERAALRRAKKEDTIFIGGSTFVVAEAI